MQDHKNSSPADIALEILRESPYRQLRELRCKYREGVLTVAGRVPSFFLKQIAQTVVRNLDGVLEIEDRIEVDTTPLTIDGIA